MNVIATMSLKYSQLIRYQLELKSHKITFISDIHFSHPHVVKFSIEFWGGNGMFMQFMKSHLPDGFDTKGTFYKYGLT